MRVCIELDPALASTLAKGGRPSLRDQRMLLTSIRDAIGASLPPVQYADDHLRISLPGGGVIVGGRYERLTVTERGILHRLLARNGEWADTDHLYGEISGFPYERNAAYRFIYMLRKKIGRRYIENEQPGLYRFRAQVGESGRKPEIPEA